MADNLNIYEEKIRDLNKKLSTAYDLVKELKENKEYAQYELDR